MGLAFGIGPPIIICPHLIIISYKIIEFIFAVPSQPVNVILKNITNSTLTIFWRTPEHPNGVIKGYRLYFMHENYTDVHTVRVDGHDDGVVDGISNTTSD